MKYLPRLTFIALGNTGIWLPVDKTIVKKYNWLAVDSDGQIVGYVDEPFCMEKMWGTLEESFMYLGAVELEAGDDWRKMKWEICQQDCSYTVGYYF